MPLTILYTKHRIEMLKFFEKYAEDADVVVLEEPENPMLINYLRGEIDEGTYLNSIDTEFPKYVSAQLKLLRELHGRGKRVVQVEPYMEEVIRMYKLIEEGRLFEELERRPSLRIVYTMERQVSQPLIRYYRAVALGNFDRAVYWTIEFAKRDAQRILLRDEMRARKLAELIDGSSRVLVEAGYIHIPLKEELEKLFGEVNVISAVEEAAREIGVWHVLHPGDILTIAFLEGRRLNCRELRLLAARALAYVALITKEEMAPEPDNPYPHLLDEQRVLAKVYRMSYDECRSVFENFAKSMDRMFYLLWGVGRFQRALNPIVVNPVL